MSFRFCMTFFCNTQKKIFWSKRTLNPIDFHFMNTKHFPECVLQVLDDIKLNKCELPL